MFSRSIKFCKVCMSYVNSQGCRMFKCIDVLCTGWFFLVCGRLLQCLPLELLLLWDDVEDMGCI